MKKTLALVALSGMLLVGCAEAQAEPKADDNYVAVCTEDGKRVDDSLCATAPNYVDNGIGMSDVFWGYLIASALMPSYGSPVTGYVTRVDETRHNVYRGGVPRTGGSLNFQTYKPLSSKVVKPKVSLKSDVYNYKYNKAPNYTKPKTDYNKPKNDTNYNKKSGGSGSYKPSGGSRRK